MVVSFLRYSYSRYSAKKILSFSVNVVIFRTLHRIVIWRMVKLLSFPIFRCRERRLIPNCSAMYFFFSPDSCIFFSSNSEFINLLASLLILLRESHSPKTVYHLRECLSTFSDKFGCKSCQQSPIVIILTHYFCVAFWKCVKLSHGYKRYIICRFLNNKKRGYPVNLE